MVSVFSSMNVRGYLRLWGGKGRELPWIILISNDVLSVARFRFFGRGRNFCAPTAAVPMGQGTIRDQRIDRLR
jgi:hypothetical protein